MKSYLDKHAIYPPLIETPPNEDLSLVIVIPAYDEHEWQKTLQSLHDCDSPIGSVEVILLINDSEKDASELKAYHAEMYGKAIEWTKQHQRNSLHYFPIYCDNLPAKHAGVGLARKIGMDEAVRRFEAINNPNGIIVGFDADSQCEKNYLTAIESYFIDFPNHIAASIHYEHPISTEDFPTDEIEAIIQYELHLRYFNNAKRYAGFPYAYETIGSAMAVRNIAYQKQGGMNKRKAGEDFYFLNKFTSLGTFGNINSTCVIPSPRQSHRVPFGTGKAVSEILSTARPLSTYAPQSFIDLKAFFEQVAHFYDANEIQINEVLNVLPESIRNFFEQQSGTKRLAEINRNTKSALKFEKRFFQWFDAFLIMKFVHFARDQYYPNVDLSQATSWLIEHYLNHLDEIPLNLKAQLLALRSWDRMQR